MNNSENQDFIFSQKPDTLVKKDNEYYTIVGEEDFLDEKNNPRLIEDSKKTLAKKIYTENKTRHLIKINTDGRFHNPINATSKPINASNFLDKTCKQPKFKNVTHETFGMYLNFLKSKNLSWLHNANRKVE